MPTTKAEMIADWQRSRDALAEHLRLMNGNSEFPDATLSTEERASVARELLGIIARYDHLIEWYGRRS